MPTVVHNGIMLAVFDGKKIEFNFHHLVASNYTFIDKDLEEKTKNFNDFKSYHKYFKSIKIILDQDRRKEFIINELNKISKNVVTRYGYRSRNC